MHFVPRLALLAVLAVCGAALSLGASGEAFADGPYGVYAWPAWERSVYVRENIPFYALHPPVYYSYPVARPYGYSPFAYPPGVKTPEVEAPRPAILQNPHIAGFGGDARVSSTAKVQPKRIQNPYVK